MNPGPMLVMLVMLMMTKPLYTVLNVPLLMVMGPVVAGRTVDENSTHPRQTRSAFNQGDRMLVSRPSQSSRMGSVVHAEGYLSFWPRGQETRKQSTPIPRDSFVQSLIHSLIHSFIEHAMKTSKTQLTVYCMPGSKAVDAFERSSLQATQWQQCLQRGL